jgi:hypothetical protein
MRSMMARLDHIGYNKVIWMLAIAETVHNVEEGIWLPAWSHAAGVWHPPVGAVEFRWAVTVITLMFYAIIFGFSRRESAFTRYLLGGALVMILFNVFVPHLTATIVTAQLAPGVVAGVLLNIPVRVYLLWRGMNEGVFQLRTLALGALLFTAIAMPLLFLSFALGRAFSNLA